MKDIVHMKIPTDNGQISLSNNIVVDFFKLAKEILPTHTLIATPFDTSCIQGDTKIVTIDCKEYSYDELNEIIEKAAQYDDLCK